MKKKTSAIREAARAELKKRKSGSVDVLSKLLKLLSPLQREFVLDESRFKLARCGRRAGKSFADAVYLIYECLKNPNTPCLYLGLTRESAKGAVWGVLTTVLDVLGIKHEALGSGPIIKFPNGSSIQLLGADAQNARNRIRGRKFKLVVVDEMGFFTEGDSLIDALLPTLADFAGTMVMTSSPGERLSGLFYEADQGAASGTWKRWTWTLLDNPMFMKPATDPRFKSLGEQELHTMANMRFNGNWQHPAFRREYLGEWVRDLTSLVYPFTEHNIIKKSRDLYAAEYGIGIDLSSSKATAIVVAKFSEFSQEVQFVEAWKEDASKFDDVALQLTKFIEKYKPTHIVAYTGGYTTAIVEEVVKRYEIPIIAGEKADKAFHQKLMRNDLIINNIKVLDGLPIIQEWNSITRDERDEEMDGSPMECSNAALFIYKRIYQTHLASYEAPKTEEERMIEELVAQAQEPEIPWYEQ